jgi:hypothetical protein
MNYKSFALSLFLISTVAIRCAQNTEVSQALQQQIDALTIQGKKIVAKCALVQRINDDVLQQSEKLFAQLELGKKAKIEFEQKLRCLIDIDQASEDDWQSYVEAELFRGLNKVVQEKKEAFVVVNNFKKKVLNLLEESASFNSMLRAYDTNLEGICESIKLLQAQGNIEVKNEFIEKVRSINAMLGEVALTGFMTLGIGAIAGLLVGAPAFLGWFIYTNINR